jgi:DNA-binding transcriptional regulator WhiA
MLESLKIWHSLPESVQYNHATTMQDVYNQLAIVYSAKEDYNKAIEYLKEAERFYSFCPEN